MARKAKTLLNLENIKGEKIKKGEIVTAKYFPFGDSFEVTNDSGIMIITDHWIKLSSTSECQC